MSKPGREPLIWLPALLLIAVALGQGILSERGLSPWIGGGFGMFANADKPGARRVRAIGTADDGQRYAIELSQRAVLDAELSPTRMKKLLAFPASAWLQELGVALLARAYRPAPAPNLAAQSLPVARPEPPAGTGPLRFVRIELSIVRLDFESDDDAPRFDWRPVGPSVEVGR